MNHNQHFRADKVREMRAKYSGWHSPVPLVVGFAVMHGNATREVVREETAQSRTPPKPNPHDPYESTMDALTDCVQGGQGRDAKDVAEVGNAVATAFEWGFYVALACVVAWACVKGCA